MLFNSYSYAIFLPVVFFIYWYAVNTNIRGQNLFVLAASYFFYGCWDWRFLSLIIVSSTVDYIIGLSLFKTKGKSKRKFFLLISLAVNLGLLGYFKYYNFFVDGFIDLFAMFNIELAPRTLNIILPVGISFYTFQTLSYTIDIYREKIEPTTDVIAFFAFISFFPQLVAGPIERAKSLLPQFETLRRFDPQQASDGLKQILWGLFKKIVIADTCAWHVDSIFNAYTDVSGSVLLLGIIYFSFQIYGDFSGYSDIAIGTAKLFGFNLMTNFDMPYFSKSIAEFWRRWHISLSTWFRDYVYIPLGGSYGNKLQRIRNVLVTFTVSGFWHGANWTFLLWGFLNGLYYIPTILFEKDRRKTKESKMSRSMGTSAIEVFRMIIIFFIVSMTWVFFRSESIHQAVDYLNRMFSWSLFTIPTRNRAAVVAVFALVAVEWIQRKKQHVLQFTRVPLVMRWSAYWVTAMLILNFFTQKKTFIYFQF